MSDLNHIRKNRKLKKEQNRSRSVTNLFSKRQAIQSEQKTDIIENETSKRYHPKKKRVGDTKQRTKLLLFPKRSNERNLILCQTSQALDLISPHWSGKNII